MTQSTYKLEKHTSPVVEPIANPNARRVRSLQVVPYPIQELRIEEFPVWYFNSPDPSAAEIANLLDILIQERCERYSCEHVLIPSIIELSLYFQCPEIQIIDAFEFLHREKAYTIVYETNYAKIYVRNNPAVHRQASEIARLKEADEVDWRDITHDFISDILLPFKHKLVSLFA